MCKAERFSCLDDCGISALYGSCRRLLVVPVQRTLDIRFRTDAERMLDRVPLLLVAGKQHMQYSRYLLSFSLVDQGRTVLVLRCGDLAGEQPLKGYIQHTGELCCLKRLRYPITRTLDFHQMIVQLSIVYDLLQSHMLWTNHVDPFPKIITLIYLIHTVIIQQLIASVHVKL